MFHPCPQPSCLGPGYQLLIAKNYIQFYFQLFYSSGRLYGYSQLTTRICAIWTYRGCWITRRTLTADACSIITPSRSTCWWLVTSLSIWGGLRSIISNPAIWVVSQTQTMRLSVRQKCRTYVEKVCSYLPLSSSVNFLSATRRRYIPAHRRHRVRLSVTTIWPPSQCPIITKLVG